MERESALTRSSRAEDIRGAVGKRVEIAVPVGGAIVKIANDAGIPATVNHDPVTARLEREVERAQAIPIRLMGRLDPDLFVGLQDPLRRNPIAISGTTRSERTECRCHRRWRRDRRRFSRRLLASESTNFEPRLKSARNPLEVVPIVVRPKLDSACAGVTAAASNIAVKKIAMSRMSEVIFECSLF